jgi:voltage-gated potassium channel
MSDVRGESGHRERASLLREVERWSEKPLIALGFLWLALMVIELTSGLPSLLERLGTAIWVIFILDFALKFTLAPDKPRFLRRNWLTAVSLLLPALRILRIARLLRFLRLTRALRGLRLIRVLASINRGMRSLRRALRRRAFGYVAAATVLVTFAGAAGMYAFENNPGGDGLNDYGTALWWTAMIMTTMGSQYWPRTPEGRLLCLFLATYAFAIFGYLTATIATYFIGRDAGNPDPSGPPSPSAPAP